MSVRTPCSSDDSDVAGRCEDAPAGDAATHRPKAARISATRRTGRLPMPGKSARPREPPHPSNELPGFGDWVGPPVAEPVEEDDLDRAGDRDRRECAQDAGQLGAD